MPGRPRGRRGETPDNTDSSAGLPVPWTRREASPFLSGNLLSVRHGADSELLVSAAAQAVLAQMMEMFPWLEVADGIVLDVLCKAKVRYDTLDAYADSVISGETYTAKGETGIEAVPDRVWQSLARLENTLVSAAGKLGLTAVDRAALTKDASWANALRAGRVSGLASEGGRLRQLRTGTAPSSS